MFPLLKYTQEQVEAYYEKVTPEMVRASLAKERHDWFDLLIHEYIVRTFCHYVLRYCLWNLCYWNLCDNCGLKRYVDRCDLSNLRLNSMPLDLHTEFWAVG